MGRAAAILAGGESQRLKTKSLVMLAGKPMILRIIDECRSVTDEVLVIVNSQEQMNSIARLVGETDARIIVDRSESFQSPLLGAHTAFENSRQELTLLLPCDTPLIKTQVLELLFSMVSGWDAVVPRHPNGHIEPLHAVYRTGVALKSAEDALSSGERSMRDLIIKLRVLYLSTETIRQLDPELESFTNVNTPAQLKQLEARITHH
ncbi:MAG: molybdenum cofactor guanylyltransferase [Candidatus Atabeyarchaeum deiterrae]